jgi:hypothetical protein
MSWVRHLEETRNEFGTESLIYDEIFQVSPLYEVSFWSVSISCKISWTFISLLFLVELTPWDKVLEKLVVVKLVKNFPAFYGSRTLSLIIVFTTLHWTLYWQANRAHTFASLRSALILSFHLSIGRFYSGFPTKLSYELFIPPVGLLSRIFHPP